jgi:hypothetical protein
MTTDGLMTLSTIGGLIVAVLLFAMAWWLVGRARQGNRKVREARRDPHATRMPAHGDAKDPQRDIPQ